MELEPNSGPWKQTGVLSTHSLERLSMLAVAEQRTEPTSGCGGAMELEPNSGFSGLSSRLAVLVKRLRCNTKWSGSHRVMGLEDYSNTNSRSLLLCLSKSE